MKKETEYLKSILNGISDDRHHMTDTLITMDFGGRLIIDGFEKITAYDCNGISVTASGRSIGISGENLIISACDKHTIRIKGTISKIELE